MSELTNISSEYELITILQKIGVNYFGDELAQERIGMFGFITESFAHMYGAMVLDSSIRSKEYLVATALKRSTLLYNAYKLGIEVPRANPTNILAYIGIKAADVENYGRLVNSNPKTYKLVLEKDMTAIIGSYAFKPEYDIELTAMYSIASEKYIYSARYLGYGDTDNSILTEYVYPEANVCENTKNNHIPVYRTGNKEKILLMKVDLKQLTKTTYDYVVTETNPISLTGIDFVYPDQFAYFNIYYKESSSTTWTFMKAIPKYDTNTYAEKVVKYEILDDDKTIRFDFTEFEPQYNSTFRIDIYSTLGEEVNDLNYNGDGSDIKITLNSLDDRHTYSGLGIACRPIRTNETGVNTLTMDELKAYIVNHSALLNAVITEPDISRYLAIEDPINDHYVRKTRSDIVNMTYDVNAKIKNEDGGVIPSRCIEVEAPTDLGTFWSAGEALESEERYCSVFDLAYTSEGVKTYASNIKKHVQMIPIDSDDSSDVNFRIDHVTITRDLNTNEYKLRVNVMTDGDYSRALSGLNNVNTGKTKKTIILRGFTYVDNTSNVVKSIFDFDFVSYSDDIFTFEATLVVDPYMTGDGRNNLSLKAMNVYDILNVNPGSSNINEDGEFIIDGAKYNTLGIDIDPTNFRFGIGCYYLEYLDNDNFLYVNDSRMQVNKLADGRTYVAKTTTIPGSGNAYPAYTGLCEYDSGTDNFDYRLCDVYSNSTDLVDLYVEMSNLVRVDHTEYDIVDGNGTPTGEKRNVYVDVPCVEIETLSEYNDRLRDIVFGSKDLLTKLKSKLLNNFEIDYKFFNTSGPSNYFTISFTNGSNENTIGDLELTVDVSIGLTENYVTLDTTKVLEVKSTIKKYIEQTFDKSETGKLYMSNVLTDAKNDLSHYIRYIELNSINGYDSRYRVIQYNAPTGSDSYVSEFISVPLNNIRVTIE